MQNVKSADIMTIRWNHDNPLARVPGETRKANVALGDYWRMGPGRSLEKLRQSYAEASPTGRPTPHLSTLKNWSADNAWQARIDRATELQQEQDEETWSRRRQKIREREWDLSTKLAEKAEAMLLFPMSRQVVQATDPDGRPVITTIEPADWRMGDVPRVADAASKLARRAAEMEEGRSGLSLRGDNLTFTVVREGEPPDWSQEQGEGKQGEDVDQGEGENG